MRKKKRRRLRVGCILGQSMDSGIAHPVWSKISNVLKRIGFRSRNFSHSCFLKPQEHVQSGFDDQV